LIYQPRIIPDDRSDALYKHKLEVQYNSVIKLQISSKFTGSSAPDNNGEKPAKSDFSVFMT
jgi:hypothetical protein